MRRSRGPGGDSGRGHQSRGPSDLSPVFGRGTARGMKNARLDEAEAGIKIDGRNINNLRYADDTTLMAETEEELKSLLMKVKEKSKKSWLKTQHSEN